MALTNFGEKKILNHILRNIESVPVSPYLALFKASPGEVGSQVDEISGNGYERQPIDFSEVTSDGTTQNSTTVTFPEATGNWGLITHWGIADSLTGGNLIMYGEVDEPKTVNKSDMIKFNPGNLTISID